jgi:superfamily I DNA and/or RNA helicase
MASLWTTVKAATVDKFQGQEKDTIILCTVDNEIADFKDSPNRLNVAV